MYLRTLLELVTGRLGSAEPTLGSSTLIQWLRVLEKLLAAQPSRAIARIFCMTGFQYCVHNSRTLGPVMSEVHPSTSFLRIYLHVYLVDGLVLSGSPTTVFYNFAFYSYVTHLS
jgi:hypothetical protein